MLLYNTNLCRQGRCPITTKKNTPNQTPKRTSAKAQYTLILEKQTYNQELTNKKEETLRQSKTECSMITKRQFPKRFHKTFKYWKQKPNQEGRNQPNGAVQHNESTGSTRPCPGICGMQCPLEVSQETSTTLQETTTLPWFSEDPSKSIAKRTNHTKGALTNYFTCTNASCTWEKRNVW